MEARFLVSTPCIAYSFIPGSIRSPAANNGIYGLKPTAFRIPTDGWSSIAPGADAIATVIGPLSTSIEGLKLFMHAIITSQPWLYEPALLPTPWDASYQITPQRSLKVGIMWHDNIVMPHPPITRALEAVASKLAAVPNLTLVDWKPHVHDEAWAIISRLYYPDGGAEDIKVMAESGEPWRPLTTWMLKENPCVKRLKTDELFYWMEEREAYRSEYAKVWNETATTPETTNAGLKGMVDAILCPVGPGVAPRHNTSKYWSYTSQWNLLDYPALSFPVCKVDKELDAGKERTEFFGELDEENWKLCMFYLAALVDNMILMSFQGIQIHLTNCRSLCSLSVVGSTMRKFWHCWSISRRKLDCPSLISHKSIHRVLSYMVYGILVAIDAFKRISISCW